MFYYLAHSLRDLFFGFNVFRYISFRSIAAAICAFLVCVIFGPAVIRRLTKFNCLENVDNAHCPQLNAFHEGKKHTPGMGGILIVSSILITNLLWSDIFNKYIILCLFSLVYLGIVGFVDDYIKIIKRDKGGLSGRVKLAFQIVLGLGVGLALFIEPGRTVMDVPLLKGPILDLGVFYVLFAILVISGTSNAVNIADGLDGLAAGSMIMVAAAYGILSYVTGHARISEYLLIPFVPGAGELTVFCSSVFGAVLGFLWFNCYPAAVFMGDVGSLSLGGALGVVALSIKKELLLVIVGGIFVAEIVSVILQVASFKLRGKRLFKVAPLHHHLQMIGWKEPKIITRFWIVSIMLALLTLLTLKLR